ncbi:GDSL esterase/lipase [Tanacetum coccineum]
MQCPANLRQNPKQRVPYNPSANHATVLPTTITEPTSFTVANNSPEWRQAMKEEYDALMKNGTWSLVPRASNTNVVDGVGIQVRLNMVLLIRRSSSFTLQAFTDVLCKGNLDTSLEAFSDADWAGDSDYRLSTGGFAIYLVWNYSRKVVGDPKFPRYFIFGDSLLDVGNNNSLKTGAKANYLPYGIDFPQGPTDRLSNGLNTADFVAKDLGFKDFIPPYATVKRQDVLKGVNYASAGSGILDESGEIVWLYKLGARKLWISGSGQIGCVPAEKRLFGPRIACVKEINDALNIFNAKILSLLVDLNINLEDAKFVYHDINNPISGLPQFDGMWRETLLTTRSVLVVKFQLKVLREGNVFRPM